MTKSGRSPIAETFRASSCYETYSFLGANPSSSTANPSALNNGAENIHPSEHHSTAAHCLCLCHVFCGLLRDDAHTHEVRMKLSSFLLYVSRRSRTPLCSNTTAGCEGAATCWTISPNGPTSGPIGMREYSREAFAFFSGNGFTR